MAFRQALQTAGLTLALGIAGCATRHNSQVQALQRGVFTDPTQTRQTTDYAVKNAMNGAGIGNVSTEQMRFTLEEIAIRGKHFYIDVNKHAKAEELPFVLYERSATAVEFDPTSKTVALTPEEVYVFTKAFKKDGTPCTEFKYTDRTW